MSSNDNTNPLNFVNQMVIGIYQQISGLESELSKAIQRDQGALLAQNGGSPQASFMELYENVHDIKTKAAQSESIIQQILRDRDKCEFAKGQLIESSVAVSQLVSLTRALNKLEFELTKDIEYTTVAGLLQTINEEMQNLSKHVLLTKLEGVKDRVDTMKQTVKRKIFRTFREIGQIMEGVNTSKGEKETSAESLVPKSPSSGSDTPSKPMTSVEYTDSIIQSLVGSDAVIACLGDDVLEELLDEIVQTQMLPYDRIGRRGGAIGSLTSEHMERRWTGLRKLLFAAEKRMGAICPPQWMLPHRIYLEFAHRTRNHFKELLMVEAEKYAMRGSDNGEFNSPAAQAYVSTLVNTLKSVIAIEEEMMEKFDDDASAMSFATTAVEEDLLGRIEEGKHMSRAFDEFMDPYVLLEKHNLVTMVEKLIAQDLCGSYDCDNFESASRMFEGIRQSMKRMMALTNGQPFLDLALEYQPCIQLYAETLRGRCPHAGKAPGKASRIFQHKMSLDEEVMVCRVVNTSEYCTEVVPKLEAQIKEKIHFSLETHINFSPQIDLFADVVSDALGVLVGGVLGQTDGALKIMKKTHWAEVADVGDESPYIAMLHCSVVDCIPRLRRALSPVYFKSLCANYATEFLDQFLAVIMSQKKICKVGAEQLLLDTNVLKTMFLRLHSLGEASSEAEKEKCSIPSVYTSIVTKRFRHIEVVLKLVCTEEENFEEMFAILYPEGTDEERFEILELKHNPSMFNSMGGAVGDFSQSTAKAVGGVGSATSKAVDSFADEIGDHTKKAFGVTTKSFRALGAVSSSSWSKLKSTTNLSNKFMKKGDRERDKEDH